MSGSITNTAVYVTDTPKQVFFIFYFLNIYYLFIIILFIFYVAGFPM
jgi:hypothetical protein